MSLCLVLGMVGTNLNEMERPCRERTFSPPLRRAVRLLSRREETDPGKIRDRNTRVVPFDPDDAFVAVSFIDEVWTLHRELVRCGRRYDDTTVRLGVVIAIGRRLDVPAVRAKRSNELFARRRVYELDKP